MKKITLDQIIHVLKTGEHGADVDGQYATRAGASLERMLMLAGR